MYSVLCGNSLVTAISSMFYIYFEVIKFRNQPWLVESKITTIYNFMSNLGWLRMFGLSWKFTLCQGWLVVFGYMGPEGFLHIKLLIASIERTDEHNFGGTVSIFVFLYMHIHTALSCKLSIATYIKSQRVFYDSQQINRLRTNRNFN